ncbi:MAG: helix-turn-helix domain-containing protein [Bifidobacteriaceae bacterium]|jgi:transcriptional regulator with XRE-family HTH domain|nr:helix-turn-helix domain-containing protein [Bifidobacteriaceae bacterium]
MGRKRVAATPAAEDALAILGLQIRMARRERNLTATELAARIGVAPGTLAAIEKGAASVTAGSIFNAAVAAGVPLFGAETPEALHMLRRVGEDKLALIPTRVRHRKVESDVYKF